MEPEDLAEYLVNDTIPEELVVKDIPQSAKAWVNKNLERAKGWSNEPYFIRDNRQFFGELKTNIYTLEEKKFTAQEAHLYRCSVLLIFFQRNIRIFLIQGWPLYIIILKPEATIDN